jgi:hypothetical protein
MVCNETNYLGLTAHPACFAAPAAPAAAPVFPTALASVRSLIPLLCCDVLCQGVLSTDPVLVVDGGFTLGPPGVLLLQLGYDRLVPDVLTGGPLPLNGSGCAMHVTGPLRLGGRVLVNFLDSSLPLMGGLWDAVRFPPPPLSLPLLLSGHVSDKQPGVEVSPVTMVCLCLFVCLRTSVCTWLDGSAVHSVCCVRGVCDGI